MVVFHRQQPERKMSTPPEKKNLLFATLNGAAVGVTACLASALVADSVATSYKAKAMRLPSLQRVCERIVTTKTSELAASWVILSVIGVASLYSFAKALEENRKHKSDFGHTR